MLSLSENVFGEKIFSSVNLQKSDALDGTLLQGNKKVSRCAFFLNEVLVGIGICFAQIPATIAFAFIAHLDPAIALHSAWIVGLISSGFGGRPAMISGATGAFAVVITTFIPKPLPGQNSGEGFETIFITILFAGFWIYLFVLFDFIKYGYLISDSVMMGFCNGLAIIIAWGQLDFFHGVSGADLWVSLGMVLISALIMEMMPRIDLRVFQYIPSSLVAIVVCIVLEYSLIRPYGAQTKSIADLAPFDSSKSYPNLFFLRYNINYSLNDIYESAYRGLLLALVGAIECLMTLEIVNKMTDSEGDRQQTVKALAAANLVSGLFGGMGGNPMVEFSAINCLNGGRGKTSGIVAALSIFTVLICGYEILNYIPLPALVGIMVIVCMHTFHWNTLPMIYEACVPERYQECLNIVKRPNIVLDVCVILTVSILTVITNLVVATGIGISLDCIGFSWDNRKNIRIESVMIGDMKVYNIIGGLFFASKWDLMKHFDIDSDPPVVEISFTQGKVYDFTALEMINELGAKYARKGKKLVIDHSSRFARALSNLHTLERAYIHRANSSSTLPEEACTLSSSARPPVASQKSFGPARLVIDNMLSKEDLTEKASGCDFYPKGGYHEWLTQ